MVHLERFLARLKEMQTKFACEALETPKQKDSFGYGEACGTYKGLKLAEQLFNEAVEETREDKGELRRRRT